jgi:hypothetical protein
VDELSDFRDGILDWRVKDIGAMHGALFQFTESADSD